MRKLDVSSITDTAQMPVKSGTLQFIQDAYAEIVSGMLTAFLGNSYNPAAMYVLWGVQNTSNPPLYNITTGYIFYQGEIFQVPATSFTASGTNVGIVGIIVSQYTGDGLNADPVTFTDLTSKNIHNIRTLQVMQGASGSGLLDFSALTYPNFIIPLPLNISAPTTGIYTGNQFQLIGAFPNIIGYVPANGNLNPILTAGTHPIGDVPSAGQTYAITFGSAISTASYYVQGTLISQSGSPANDPTVIFAVIDSSRTTAGFSIRIQEFNNIAQSLAFEYIIFKK